MLLRGDHEPRDLLGSDVLASVSGRARRQTRLCEARLGPTLGTEASRSHTLGPVEGVEIKKAEKQDFFFPPPGRVFRLDTGETFSPVVSQLVAYRKLLYECP